MGKVKKNIRKKCNAALQKSKSKPYNVSPEISNQDQIPIVSSSRKPVRRCRTDSDLRIVRRSLGLPSKMRLFKTDRHGCSLVNSSQVELRALGSKKKRPEAAETFQMEDLQNALPSKPISSTQKKKVSSHLSLKRQQKIFMENVDVYKAILAKAQCQADS